MGRISKTISPAAASTQPTNHSVSIYAASVTLSLLIPPSPHPFPPSTRTPVKKKTQKRYNYIEPSHLNCDSGAIPGCWLGAGPSAGGVLGTT